MSAAVRFLEYLNLIPQRVGERRGLKSKLSFAIVLLICCYYSLYGVYLCLGTTLRRDSDMGRETSELPAA
jgi:hypothetical protein